MKLTILGTAAGGSFQGRNFTAQVLQVESQLFLLDCGEGTQHQIFRHKIKIDRVRQIFISHLHGDHVFGLIGLITGFCLKKRTTPLTIFSPAGLREIIETQIRICAVRMSYPIHFQEIDTETSQIVFENNLLEVRSVPLRHRLPASGWLFREKPKQRHIRPDKIQEFGIDFKLIPGIKKGDDLQLPDGRRIENSELTLPPSPARSFAFCSDTAFHLPIANVVGEVDLLYHEATFTDDAVADADFTMHSTASQAAEIARLAGAKRLVIGHISARYKDWTTHLEEARAVFPETFAADDGSVFKI